MSYSPLGLSPLLGCQGDRTRNWSGKKPPLRYRGSYIVSKQHDIVSNPVIVTSQSRYEMEKGSGCGSGRTQCRSIYFTLQCRPHRRHGEGMRRNWVPAQTVTGTNREPRDRSPNRGFLQAWEKKDSCLLRVISVTLLLSLWFGDMKIEEEHPRLRTASEYLYVLEDCYSGWGGSRISPLCILLVLYIPINFGET